LTIRVEVAFRDQLIAARNRDGGWGYAPGKRSRLEPTCLAFIALGSDTPGASAADVLARWPARHGLLVDADDLPVNYAFNGLALIETMRLGPSLAPRARELAAGLVAAKGVALEPSAALGQDARLQAWSWVDETFSWVEPTAWCLLGLKKWRGKQRDARLDARVGEAERLLLDRTCATGGWNYGNARVFDQSLSAYVPTTALGLLAMQDRVEIPHVRRSLEFLERSATREPSALALAMALVALNVFGRPVDGVHKELTARVGIASAIGQVCGMALGAYALEFQAHECAAFRL
jgi:hypothetical protein